VVAEENSFQLNTTKKTAMNFETMVTNQLSSSSLFLAFNTSTPEGEIIQKYSLFLHFLPSLKYPFVYTYLKMVTPPHKNNITIIVTLGFKKTFILNYKEELLKRTCEIQSSLNVSIYIDTNYTLIIEQIK
jgi:hypothetical protein